MAKTPAWYEIRAAAGNTRAQVYIFGPIVDYKWDDDDVTAREFIDGIKSLGDFDLRINSPGGSVPAGNAIYNALRRHTGSIDVYVEGLAASIASVIAMGGTRVIMPANAMLMIHDPWSMAYGNAQDMRKMAETLDKFKAGLVAAYQAKTGIDATEIEQMMSDETWLTAQEALELGFADQIEEPTRIAASFDLSRFRHPPKALFGPPPRVEAQPQNGGKTRMNIDNLRTDHPDIVAQIEAAARQGLIAQADADTARAEAVSAERARLLDLVAAAIGEDGAGKIRAAADKGLTAEDLAALGVSLAPAAARSDDTAARMLAAITAAAPVGVQGAKPESGPEAERASLAKAIAAGANAK